MAAKQLTIHPLTIPAGQRVFGPVPLSARWTSFDLLLDITNAAQPFDVLVEESVDGVTWEIILANAGVAPYVKNGVPVTTLELSANWAQSRSSVQVRVTAISPAPFASSGGTVTLQ